MTNGIQFHLISRALDNSLWLSSIWQITCKLDEKNMWLETFFLSKPVSILNSEWLISEWLWTIISPAAYRQRMSKNKRMNMRYVIIIYEWSINTEFLMYAIEAAIFVCLFTMWLFSRWKYGGKFHFLLTTIEPVRIRSEHWARARIRDTWKYCGSKRNKIRFFVQFPYICLWWCSTNSTFVSFRTALCSVSCLYARKLNVRLFLRAIQFN